MNDYTPSELMITSSARALAGERVVFVGVGQPNIACNLARRTVAPDLELVYESGVFGARPARLPLSIGDPTLVSGATLACSMPDLFMYYLQGGRIEVAFLGAAQIDRFGNLNTTVIGDYHRPKVRLPGSGGACEIAIHAKKVYLIMPLGKRAFVERIDFCTSPGHLDGPGARAALGMPGGGPRLVVTDKAILTFDAASSEMVLSSVHPGVSVEEVQAGVGWPLKIAADLATTEPPTAEELRLIREELDPDGVYTGK
ncbi:MAG: CoA-transferase [Anaerolineae bacterium]|jgi:glutaconate CoA-transferase subunit B|nr:CoA-transferase [Anaerolineae bacterium]